MSTVIETNPRLLALTEAGVSAENPLVEGLEHPPVHPTTLVVFGATGDLSRRKLLPALYNLAHDGALPERFELVGVARGEHPREDFRELARMSIERFSRRRPDRDVLDGLLAEMRYLPGCSMTTTCTPSSIACCANSTTGPATR